MQKLAALQNQQTQAVAQQNLQQVASAQNAAVARKPQIKLYWGIKEIRFGFFTKFFKQPSKGV